MAEGEVEESLYVMVKKGQESEISQEVNIDDSLTAPIKEGEKLGELTVFNGDQALNKVNVIAAEDIDKANIIVRIWRSIINFITGFFN